VRDGLVRTYDVLALPTSSRWGGTLIGAYVNERGHQYNLLDAIFASTDEGVLSLAAIRDSGGEPVDFQIVHLNQGASRLLKLPSNALQWHRLNAGGHALCLPGSARGCSAWSKAGPAISSRSTAKTAICASAPRRSATSSR
jgi:hypothetical protein